MPRASRPAFLRLVHSASETIVAPPSAVNAGQAQDIFFPSARPNTLIFLAWEKASPDDLLDVFELSKPTAIFDLRPAPRFDLGSINRKRFFEITSHNKCEYIDLLGRMEVADNVGNALLNPALVAAQVESFTSKLTVPNCGPFVFLHDDDFFDDDYVSAFAKALPNIGSEWQVYRPLSSARGSPPNDQSTTRSVAEQGDVTPIVRRAIFISHATPEDNSFVAWLSSKLMAAGYDVWCDLSDLSGGDGFWSRIEEVIRVRAAKVLFVHSDKVKDKVGTRKEVYLALKVGERNRIPRFVIPMRIDATPFDDTMIELIDIQSVDCRSDWLIGLKSVLLILQRDNVPRAGTFKAEQFSNLVAGIGRPVVPLVKSDERLSSNWLPIFSFPARVKFFSCAGIASNELPGIATRLSVPAIAFYTHLATTADAEKLADALKGIGLGEIRLGERAALSWTDFAMAKWGDLPTVRIGEARRYSVSLLNRAWALFMDAHRMSVGFLANERLFWYFADQRFAKNEVRFTNHSGQSIRRQLVGFSQKRKVFWHFGVHARCLSAAETTYFSLSPHVTFSVDGKTPLASKAHLHSLRRSFCRSWWNNRWRDLLQAFVSALASGEDHLELDVGSDVPMRVSAVLAEFVCPVALAGAEEPEQTNELMADDYIKDEWEEEEEAETDDEMVDLVPSVPQGNDHADE